MPDLKLINRTLREMRYTTRVFGPYRDRKKVTIFGSARTKPEDEMYQTCVRFGRLLADKGWMIITGGGGGIMQAGNEGAGSENSFAVNIRLPFEQNANPVMQNNPAAGDLQVLLQPQGGLCQGGRCRGGLPRWLRHPG